MTRSAGRRRHADVDQESTSRDRETMRFANEGGVDDDEQLIAREGAARSRRSSATAGCAFPLARCAMPLHGAEDLTSTGRAGMNLHVEVRHAERGARRTGNAGRMPPARRRQHTRVPRRPTNRAARHRAIRTRDAKRPGVIDVTARSRHAEARDGLSTAAARARALCRTNKVRPGRPARSTLWAPSAQNRALGEKTRTGVNGVASVAAAAA